MIENRVRIGEGARLAWLPQETILFDHARLRRRFEVDLAADAGLLAVEIVAFGRAARRERIGQGLFATRGGCGGAGASPMPTRPSSKAR